jgi:glycosyltransferase involved in cell wall biosynthesis
MKLLYTIIFFGREPSGVQKKIIAQVKNLNALGLSAVIYSLTAINDDSPLLPEVNKIIIPNLEYNPPKSFFAKKRRINIRDYAYKKIIETLRKDEILYTRIPSPSGITSELLKNPRKGKIVIEYQTIEPIEGKLAGNYVYLLNDFFFGDDIRKYTDGIVGVTDQITRYEVTRSGDPEKPHITIGNGINVETVNVHQQVPYSGEELRLLCVANFNRWHGLDRLIRGIGTYRGPTRITLDIAGDGSELPYFKKIIHELAITDKVKFHGLTIGTDLDNLFNTCHIAVGSLGMHRKGLTQTSELKAREYCARGIPYIISCSDPDFPDDFPYICRFPSNESEIDVEMIIEFAQKVYQDPDYPFKMRAYAVEHLDWSVKMQILKTFLETLVDSAAKPLT